jgi:hypothetical protein
VLFKPDEQLDAIVSAKAGHCAGAMLVDSGEDVGRHSSVESAVALGGKKVDAGLEVGVHWGLFSWVPAFAGMTNFAVLQAGIYVPSSRMSAADSPKAPKIRRDGWTPRRQLLFINALTRTRSVTRAAASVGPRERPPLPQARQWRPVHSAMAGRLGAESAGVHAAGGLRKSHRGDPPGLRCGGGELPATGEAQSNS